MKMKKDQQTNIFIDDVIEYDKNIYKRNFNNLLNYCKEIGDKDFFMNNFNSTNTRQLLKLVVRDVILDIK